MVTTDSKEQPKTGPGAAAGFRKIVDGIDDFRAHCPDLSVLELRRFGEARELNARAEKLEMDLAVRKGRLVPLAVVREIRDETVEGVGNILGPSLEALLIQRGVPVEAAPDIAKEIHTQVYGLLRVVYTQAAQRLNAAQEGP